MSLRRGWTSSDGMRAFIALLAYTAVNAEGLTPPVLLVDEAELHLHYAAQADLVQVLTEQTAASQVIYTTHSAGCLPEDIGTGVRLVVPIDGADRSRVINWFWDDDEPGFGPLLHGMGYAAGAFAFTPARFAVFAEGATELVLLPTLLREATGRRRIEFQVAPGLALVNRDTASTLKIEAARVQVRRRLRCSRLGDRRGAARRRRRPRRRLRATRSQRARDDHRRLRRSGELSPGGQRGASTLRSR